MDDKWVTPHTSPHKAFRKFPAVTCDCFDLLRGVLFCLPHGIKSQPLAIHFAFLALHALLYQAALGLELRLWRAQRSKKTD